MYILNLTEPLVLLAAVLIYALFMILGKEFKNSKLTAIPLVLFLVTLAIYGVQLAISPSAEATKMIMQCFGYNVVLVFLSYISYLWVDDIEAKAKNKKSIDDSLNWFWEKV